MFRSEFILTYISVLNTNDMKEDHFIRDRAGGGAGGL